VRILSRFEDMDPTRTGVPAKWWVPKRLKPLDRDRFHLEFRDVRYTDGSMRRHWIWAIRNPIERRAELIPPAEAESYIHHVWLDTEEAYGYGYGLSDAVAVYHELKQLFVKYLATGLERFAWPWIIAKTNDMSEPVTAELGAAFKTDRKILERLAKMRLGGILHIDTEDEITTLDLGAKGNSIILQAIDYLDKMIVEVILGASAQVGGHGTQANSGAYASDKVEDSSSQAYMGYDRESLEDTINDQLIARIIKFNRANLDALGMAGMIAPRFRLGIKKRDDPMTAIAELAQLKVAFPEWKFVKSQVTERTGWDYASDEDIASGDVLESAQPIFDMLGGGGGVADTQTEENPQPAESPQPAEFGARRDGARMARFHAMGVGERLGMARAEIARMFSGATDGNR